MMKVDYELQRIGCRDCRGTGQSRNGPDLRCEYCGGSGWVETYSARQQRLTQPAPETGGEWSQFEFDKRRIVDSSDGRSGVVVAHCDTEQHAAQIVREHNSVPLLVSALKELLLSPVEFEDERLHYVTIQVDRAAIKDAQDVLAAVGLEEEHGT